MLEADRVGPRQRAARVVEPERQAGVDVGGAADALADARTPHSLTSWQTIRPSTRPGRVADPDDVCSPSEAKKRSARSRGRRRSCRRPRVSSTSARLSGGSAWKPTARAAAVERVQRALGAQQRLRRRPAAAARRRSAPQSRMRTGTSPSASSGGARPSPPRPRARAARRRRGRCAGDRRRGRRRRRPSGGSGRPGGAAGRRAYAYQPRPALRPWRPAATIRALSGDGRQRGSPKHSS